MLNNKNHSYFKGQQQSLSAGLFSDGQEQVSAEYGNEIRKPYCKPELEEFGDLRSLTFGSFPGVFDSGGLGSFVPP